MLAKTETQPYILRMRLKNIHLTKLNREVCKCCILCVCVYMLDSGDSTEETSFHSVGVLWLICFFYFPEASGGKSLSSV